MENLVGSSFWRYENQKQHKKISGARDEFITLKRES